MEARRDCLPLCRPHRTPLLIPKPICNTLGYLATHMPRGLGQGCTYGSMLTGVASPITERTGGVTSELSMDKEHIGKWPLRPFRKTLPS